MKIINTTLTEVKIIEPKVFGDARGFFYESYHEARYKDAGIQGDFVQDNLSRSHAGVLRGLHYQLKYPQAKLVTVVRGEVFDVVVDIRVGSPTFGKWFGTILNDTNHRQLYIPAGFAHGFCVLSETVDFHYKCTDYYHVEDEYGILWNDKDIGIEWPLARVSKPLLSEKDEKNKALQSISHDLLPMIRARRTDKNQETDIFGINFR
jgi:dTDP-4-dehydrorhamnose 3,5-epimerase